MLVLLPLVGLLIGLLVISLGGGGGAFYVGILTAFFNIPPELAASTSLATIVPTTVFGAVSHWKNGNVNLRLGLIMMGGAAAGAVAGSLCSDFLPESIYNKITGILLLILAVQMLAAYVRRRSGKAPHVSAKSKKSLCLALGYGFLGGGLSGLVGISGTAPIVAGLVVLGCGALETVGTSVFVLVGISLTGFLMHLGLGNVDWRLVGLLVIGTAGGAFAAPFLLRLVRKNQLEKILISVLIVMGFVMGGIVACK